MTTTYGEFKKKVIRLLGDEVQLTDPISGAQTSSDSLQDAVHAALSAICNRYPKSFSYQLTPGSGETFPRTDFSIPSDCIDIEGILDHTNSLFLPQIEIMVDQSPYGTHSHLGNAWECFNNKFLKFETALIGTEIYMVYYSGMWNVPSDDGDVIDPPDFMIPALTMYATSYCHLAAASSAGNIRQYATKVDSGTPTDNPLKDLSDFFLKRYETEMQRIQSKPRGKKN